MATATQISTRALRRLGVVENGGTPSSADIDAASEALTAMINAWEAEGMTADVLPLDARFEQAIVAMLAVRLAEEYGKEPGGVLLRDAANGWSALQAAFFAVPAHRFEDALIHTGHYQDYGYIYGNEPRENYSAWEASTAYSVREYVTNGGMLYECITAGTSASSGGPTGTSAEVTDGTVTWCWRRVHGEP